MLVLGRKIGEVICVGDDIKIHVCDILPDKRIRIGITAPRSVKIRREELCAKFVGTSISETGKPSRLETESDSSARSVKSFSVIYPKVTLKNRKVHS